MMIGGGQSNTTLISGLGNSPIYVFWLKKFKNDIKTALTSTDIKL